ncbi:MAG: NADH-quinone oxidoreductase subunit A [Thermoleophilaceae bacterium]
MLKSYLPALVFLFLGGAVGIAFTMLNSVLGPSRPGKVKSEPYESGLPSDVRKDFRFGVSFYLIAMLFILFDIEVVFLYPIAVQLETIGAFALVETIVFVVLLLVAFVFVWRRGRWNGSDAQQGGRTGGLSLASARRRSRCCAATSWTRISRSSSRSACC